MNDRSPPSEFANLVDTPWERPPAHARRRVNRFPAVEPAPPQPRVRVQPSQLATDVRSTAELLATGQILTRSHDVADVTVEVMPREGQRLVRLEGVVWFRQDEAATATIALVQLDHVLASRQVNDGEVFELEEVLGPSTHLEVHFEGGDALVWEIIP